MDDLASELTSLSKDYKIWDNSSVSNSREERPCSWEQNTQTFSERLMCLSLSDWEAELPKDKAVCNEQLQVQMCTVSPSSTYSNL